MSLPQKQCTYQGCNTRLSRYNKGEFCSVHEMYERTNKKRSKKIQREQKDQIEIPFDELTEFWWPVSTHGYQIEKIGEAQFLVESPVPKQGDRLPMRTLPKFEQPYKNKSLFIEFANLKEKDLNQILQFVNKNGLLTVPEDRTKTFLPKGRRRKEPLDLIQQEVKRVRKLFYLHEAIQNRDLDYLNKHIETKKSKYQDGGREFTEIVVSFDGKEILEVTLHFFKLLLDGEYVQVDDWVSLMNKLAEEDIEIAAKLCLSQEVARSVALHVFPTVRLTPDARLQPVYSARTLLGAIYHQLYLAVTEGWRYRRCKECGNLFTLTRKDKEFCSEACENRYHVREFRRRKREGGDN